MAIYFAPMEGITGKLFRRIHRTFFPGVDKYFMPFVSPGHDGVFSKRDMRELAPEPADGYPVIPQLLTCKAEDFLWAARLLADMGYSEVNLNLGCPSGTVTAKGKGAGFLRNVETLDRFLEQIFYEAPVAISVKTRVGVQCPEEFGPILECFARYPISELIVHPRVRNDFYRGSVRMEAFAQAAEGKTAPLCYNGDLTTPEEVWTICRRFPNVERMMIGRGLVGDPALADKVKGGAPASRRRLRQFHDALYEGYAAAFSSRYNAMLRMKELWFYLIWLFEENEAAGKRLRKSKTTWAYEESVDRIFGELKLRQNSAGGWRDRVLLESD